MLSRDDLFNRLIYLVPEAKFVFWPDEGNDDTKGYKNVVKIPGWVIAWYPENIEPLPSLQAINAIDAQVLAEALEVKRKTERDKERATNLSTVAAYLQEKKTDPSLKFSEYIDYLEQQSIEILEGREG